MQIEPCDGVDAILTDGFIGTKLKSREVAILGVVIDADDDCASAWSRLRTQCEKAGLAVPADLPDAGLICGNADGKRVGAWIMPDNKSRGMLETFLRFLVRDEQAALWQHAADALARARDIGAPCRDCHMDKARIHTWLAWQDPPGPALGTALIRKCLDAHSPLAEPFLKWFRTLYDL